MFEGTYSPPFYLDLYNFKDGAQNDIFSDSYTSIPTPGPNQKEVPTPINQPVPQPTSTDTAQRNSTTRTAGEFSALSALIKALFPAMAWHAGLF